MRSPALQCRDLLTTWYLTRRDPKWDLIQALILFERFVEIRRVALSFRECLIDMLEGVAVIDQLRKTGALEHTQHAWL